MALFNKLFSSHKRKTITTTAAQSNTKKFPFTNEQVRILLYRECDSRGKKLLFDSTALQKVPTSTEPGRPGEKTQNYIEISNGYRYFRPRDTDHNSLGEMIFGSVAMSFRGTALKVHWLQAPARLLCSQVFLSPIQGNKFSDSTIDTQYSDLNSMDTSSFNSFSLSLSVCVSDNLNTLGQDQNTNPLDVPLCTDFSDGVHSVAYSDSGYSGTDPWNISSSSFYPYSSTRSSVSSMYSEREVRRKLSVDSSIPDSGVGGTGRSDSNLQRRVLRNISTSFENKLSNSDCIGYFEDSTGQTTTNGGSEGCVIKTRRCSEQVESRSNPEMIRKRGASGDTILNMHSRARAMQNRRVKLGLAVCITLSDTVEDEMQLYCSEHIPLLESMLCRLRAKAENAYLNKKNFYQAMLHAWFSTTEWITDLFTAPRLEKPVWLTLSSGTYIQPAQLAQNFMTELCYLLSNADTKDTNFFISTLLTAILTHHLGWVGTVAPLSNCTNNSSNTAAEVADEEKAKMSEISRFRPYNPLWAQLGDLYGSIGSPPKVSKTIVSGNHRQTIDKVLNVLTYFIRCGEIRRESSSAFVDKRKIDEVLSKNSNSNKLNSKKTTDSLSDLAASVANKPISQTIPKKNPGLTKTATCMKDLNTLNNNNNNGECSSKEKTSAQDDILRSVLLTLKKNEIPNVLVFRDSRFVQQELRIGNFQMDTGIEMNPKQKSDIKTYQIKEQGGKIKFLITSPDDENMTEVANDEHSHRGRCTERSQSLPPELGKIDPDLSPLAFFWGIEPIKKSKKTDETSDGQGSEMNDGSDRSDKTRELKRSHSLYTKSTNAKNPEHVRKSDAYRRYNRNSHVDKIKSENIETIFLKSCPSLSDLITANSVGVSERFTWGIERVKEAVSYEEEKHFEFAKEMIEKSVYSRKNSSVVFVLGENEELVGLKHVNQDDKYYQKMSSSMSTTSSKDSNSLKNKFRYLAPGDSYGYYERSIKSGLLNSIIEQRSNEETEFDDDSSDTRSEYSTDKVDGSEKIPNGKQFEGMQIINLPMPQSIAKDDKGKQEFKLDHPGFVPSLFVGITDHYIADVVLQGTVAPPSSWESTLKQNLALQSHCATIEQAPTENVAIIANTDHWDVKIVSSQTYVLPCGSGTSGPIGMSQLVSSMLETVQAMWNAGTCAYQCMSYIESKLRELYLQSEVLATFLLATEFCSLSTVTSALNLSANDVPLLLSVASIHSPQVTKKYGVSFR